MSGGILILGAGQAAAQLAISLRQGGYDGAIRMVGDEPYAPYQRPPLSKAFLKERPAADSLLLRGDSYWSDHKVQLELGTPAAAVDLAGKQATLRDGRTFDYDTLVLATGTRARDLPVPGIALPGFIRFARSTMFGGCARRSTTRGTSPSSAAATSGSKSRPSCGRRAATRPWSRPRSA